MEVSNKKGNTMDNNAYLHQVNLMDVTAEQVSTNVRVYDSFATVTVNIGRMTFTLFTTTEDEAKAIVAKFVMPTVSDQRVVANA
jgi:hypothetical protein